MYILETNDQTHLLFITFMKYKLSKNTYLCLQNTYTILIKEKKILRKHTLVLIVFGFKNSNVESL